jgi:uncharacterized peroxidase-related enzyme
MPQLIEEHEAEGKVKEVYEEIKKDFGVIPNFFKAQAAVSPAWLDCNYERWKLIMKQESSLDRKMKELVALAISYANRCAYCTPAHTGAAKMAGASEDELHDLVQVVELYQSFNQIAFALQVPIESQ